MSETPTSPESPTGPVTTTQTPGEPPTYADRGPYREHHRRGRLTAVAAWVGILAGVVFIVAVVFFTGFILGAHAGGHGGGGHHRGHHDSAMMEHGSGMRGQRQGPPFGPGGGPYFQSPQPSQSSGAPTTTTPSRP